LKSLLIYLIDKSEAVVFSIGSGSGVDHLFIVSTYVNRHEREEDILLDCLCFPRSQTL